MKTRPRSSAKYDIQPTQPRSTFRQSVDQDAVDRAVAQALQRLGVVSGPGMIGPGSMPPGMALFRSEPPTSPFQPLPHVEPQRQREPSVRSFRGHAQQALEEAGLTQQEVSVGLLVLQGLSNEGIAHELEISTKTVKHHVGNVFKKFRVKRREQLFARVFPV